MELTNFEITRNIQHVMKLLRKKPSVLYLHNFYVLLIGIYLIPTV